MAQSPQSTQGSHSWHATVSWCGWFRIGRRALILTASLRRIAGTPPWLHDDACMPAAGHTIVLAAAVPQVSAYCLYEYTAVLALQPQPRSRARCTAVRRLAM